jgi:hypothetical protein
MATKWEAFETIRDMVEAIKSQPFGTFKGALIHNTPIRGPKSVWKIAGVPHRGLETRADDF